MNLENIRLQISKILNSPIESFERSEILSAIEHFLSALETGALRAAYLDETGNYVADTLVKEGILLCFRVGQLRKFNELPFCFLDKDTIPTQQFELEQKVRIVPGGSSVRRGAFLGNSVTMMPPSYINIGAFVDEGTMVDSHALVGSCAQIGKRVHLSAAAQIGGVLEPVGATPVVIEDDAFIGGNCGVYEGTIIRSRAVLGAGVILTKSSLVYDLVNGLIIKAEAGRSLEIPPGAVVVPGSRPARGEFAREHGINLSCNVIVKYRDNKTDGKALLEEALR